MSNLSSLELAVSVAKRLRDQAQQDLNQAQQSLLFEQGQFVQLQSYSDETEARWITQSRSVSSPELMRHYYQFMGKLQQAVAMQRDIVQDAVRRVELRQEALLQVEFTLSGRESLCQQARSDLRQRAERQEQKLNDDMAAVQHQRHKRALDAGEP